MLKREDFELRKEAAAASKLARRDQLRCVGGVCGGECVFVTLTLPFANNYYGQFRYTGNDS